MLMRLKISNTDTHGVQGVASSNPAAPTKNTKGFQHLRWKPFFLSQHGKFPACNGIIGEFSARRFLLP